MDEATWIARTIRLTRRITHFVSPSGVSGRSKVQASGLLLWQGEGHRERSRSHLLFGKKMQMQQLSHSDCTELAVQIKLYKVVCTSILKSAWASQGGIA